MRLYPSGGNVEQYDMARILFHVNPPFRQRILIFILGLFILSPSASGVPSKLPPPGPAVAPSTAPSTQPATTRLAASRSATTSSAKLDEKATRRKLLELTRKSIDLLQKKKFAQAESALAEALAIDPQEPTNLYNMACLLALTSRPDAAIDFLQRSADAGFIDFLHIARDTDLDSLHADARFQAFMARKDFYQRKAAEAAM